LSRCVWYGALAMLLVVGLIDQTPRSTAPPYASLQEAYRRDEVFVRRLETALPAGAMILRFNRVRRVSIFRTPRIACNSAAVMGCL